jgi:hypothetical protein
VNGVKKAGQKLDKSYPKGGQNGAILGYFDGFWGASPPP